MVLNNAGKMVFEKFSEISKFYPDIIIDKFIVMSNHLHAILLIQHTETGSNNGTVQHIGTARGPFPTFMSHTPNQYNEKPNFNKIIKFPKSN